MVLVAGWMARYDGVPAFSWSVCVLRCRFLAVVVLNICTLNSRGLLLLSSVARQKVIMSLSLFSPLPRCCSHVSEIF